MHHSTDFGGRSVIRIVDHCLAAHGWTRTARLKMLNALRDGDHLEPLSRILADEVGVGVSKVTEAEGLDRLVCERVSPRNSEDLFFCDADTNNVDSDAPSCSVAHETIGDLIDSPIAGNGKQDATAVSITNRQKVARQTLRQRARRTLPL